MRGRRVLVARLDNVGDVLLAGPTARAAAAGAAHVTFLAGPTGRAAAEMLPGVDEVVVWEAPWVPLDAPAVGRGDVDALVDDLAARRIEDALVLTSFHQSSLPLALLLRMAGVERIAATSVDHPGTLLDERLPYVDELHEVEQALTVAAALGYRLPPDDDGALAVRPPPLTPEGANRAAFITEAEMIPPRVGEAGPAEPPELVLPDRFVAVHPAASVPARALPPAILPGLLDGLVAAGHSVVLTGAAADRTVTAPLAVGRPDVFDRAGGTDLVGLAAILRRADALVVGNTGPAHLAAAVGTPVVSAFAPVVAPHRWAPWRVPHRMLGVLDIACAGCRSRVCPFPGQPCLDPVTPVAVVAAVAELMAPRATVPTTAMAPATATATGPVAQVIVSRRQEPKAVPARPSGASTPDRPSPVEATAP